MDKSFLPRMLPMLTGEESPLPDSFQQYDDHDVFAGDGLGHSQFNELLLSLGYDRVSHGFFEFVFQHRRTGEDAVRSEDEFSAGIAMFQKMAIRLWGNVKFGFKQLRDRSYDEIVEVYECIQPVDEVDFVRRHAPLRSIDSIPPEDTYYLGYLVDRERQRLQEECPDSLRAKELAEKIPPVRLAGKQNHDTYLSYDYMDVYVATSMREPHEFFVVSQFTKELFSRQKLARLNLRWFDPTQAYCPDRIDKGLVEALMLKRARCTIYHAQETDTFGKDSELASTLAQGKPVIAFVPELHEENRDQFVKDAMLIATRLYPDDGVNDLVKRLLRQYAPDVLWDSGFLRGWLDKREEPSLDQLGQLIYEKAKALYDRRANALRETHPLGLQVNLDTGVANGVLVVRSVPQCAVLLEKVLLNRLEFTVEESETAWLLKETTTDCVYRVVTKDKLLCNSFWNFYHEPGDIPRLPDSLASRKARNRR